jgi:hypothetical protein
MTNASECRKNAEECRALAKHMKQDSYRDQLLNMAKTWDRLASDKEAGSAIKPDAAPAKPQKT